MGATQTMNALSETLADVTDLNDLPAMLEQISQAFGVAHASYLGVTLPRLSRNEPYVSTTYPKAWVDRYMDQNYFAIDPVLNVAPKTILPTNWSTFRLNTTTQRRFFAEARLMGVGSQGLSVPIRGRFGETALFSVSTSEDPSIWSKYVSEYISAFQIIGFHFHETLMRLHDVEPEQTRLSPRERECLAWIAAGKTTEDVATILGISTHTIKQYLEMARVKLQALTRAHAVALALSRGLIPPPE